MTSNDRFFNRVYEVVKQVPYGKVTSYGAIARYLGAPGAARMVGWAMNQCHYTTGIRSCTPGGEPNWNADWKTPFQRGKSDAGIAGK